MNRKMPRLSSEVAFIEDFINQYKLNECLWDVKCETYHNQRRRDDAYRDLTNLVRKHYGDKLANKDYVLKKIKNLRTVFKKEMNKVNRSKVESPDNIYVPKLWYFDLLKFLIDKDVTQKSYTIDDDSDDPIAEDCDENDDEPEIIVS